MTKSIDLVGLHKQDEAKILWRHDWRTHGCFGETQPFDLQSRNCPKNRSASGRHSMKHTGAVNKAAADCKERQIDGEHGVEDGRCWRWVGCDFTPFISMVCERRGQGPTCLTSLLKRLLISSPACIRPLSELARRSEARSLRINTSTRSEDGLITGFLNDH